MGVVYLAHDPRLDRSVALKTYVLPEGLPDAERREVEARFLREARAAAALSHPGIVPVFDAGTADGLPWLAMEYVPGPDLERVLAAEGPLDAQRVRRLVPLLAGALAAAHAAGIVHRDVKPANVLLGGPDGPPKLTDFGIARPSSSTLTRSGTTVGSPAYMSPEQIRGGDLDGRSDLFSLAVVLYESLCGARPFGGEDTAALVYEIVHAEPRPPSARRRGLSPQLDGFFRRALAKRPEERFPDAATFARAFDAAVAGADVAPTAGDAAAAGRTAVVAAEEPESRRALLPRRAIVAAALVLVATCGAILLVGSRRAHLQLEARSSVEAGELTLLIDGEEVYRRTLAAPQQKGGLLRKIVESRHESFEAWIDVGSGRREVAAEVRAEGEPAPWRDAIVVDLEPGATHRLRLQAGRGVGPVLSLKMD